MSLQKDEKKTPEKTLKMGSFPGAYLCIICTVLIFKTISGERGIRTPGASQLNGFQDRRDRPLCHLSLLYRKNISSRKALQR